MFKCYVTEILLRRNNIEQEQVLIEEHIDKVRKDIMRKREGSFLRLLGEVHAKRNESDNAIKTFNESIRILNEVENSRQLWQAYCSLASVFDKMGRHSEAMEHWGAALAMINPQNKRHVFKFPFLWDKG